MEDGYDDLINDVERECLPRLLARLFEPLGAGVSSSQPDQRPLHQMWRERFELINSADTELYERLGWLVAAIDLYESQISQSTRIGDDNKQTYQNVASKLHGFVAIVSITNPVHSAQRSFTGDTINLLKASADALRHEFPIAVPKHNLQQHLLDRVLSMRSLVNGYDALVEDSRGLLECIDGLEWTIKNWKFFGPAPVECAAAKCLVQIYSADNSDLSGGMPNKIQLVNKVKDVLDWVGRLKVLYDVVKENRTVIGEQVKNLIDFMR